MVDDSHSELSSDPHNRRTEAAAFALRMASSVSTRGLVHRAAVVRFGTTAPSRLAAGPFPLPRATDRLRRLVRSPHVLGGTSFPAAFERLRALMHGAAPVDTSCKRHRTTVFVITDGGPNAVPGHASTRREFAKIERALSTIPNARVYLLGTDADGSFSRTVPHWRKLGVMGLVTLDGLGPLELERVYARLLAHQLGLPEPQDHVLTPRVPTARFALPAFTERLLVVSFSASDGSVAVADPNGRVVGATRGHAGVLTVDRPVAGSWLPRLRSGGRVLVSAFRVPGEPRLISPSADWPQGRELRPSAQLLTRSGQPLISARFEPPFVEATVVGPGVRREALALSRTVPGRYVARLGTPTVRPGTYEVTLSVRAGNQAAHEVARRSVHVKRSPYLAITSVSDRARKSVSVEAELRIAGHAVDARQVVADSPDGIALATLRRGHERPRVSRMHWLGGSRFRAAFGVEGIDSKRQSIVVRLTARDAAGHTVRDVTAASVVPHLTTGDHLRDGLVMAMRIAVGLAFLVLLVYVVWLASRPPIDDDYWVPPPGAGPDGKPVLIHRRTRLRMLRGPRLRGPHVWVFSSRGRVVAVTSIVPLPWGGAFPDKANLQGPPLRKRVTRERRAA